jgi:hypothetical protein
MSEEEEGEVRKGDPNPARLLAKIMDYIDVTLVKHGFEFREDKDWETFGGSLLGLFFEHYEDHTGGDSSYVPGETTSGSDSGESVSESLGESDTHSESAEESPKKRARE